MKELKLYNGKIQFYYYKGKDKYILQSYQNHHGTEFDNFIWYDELRFKSFSRGRSSVKADFESEKYNLELEMFIKDLSDIILENQNLTDLCGYFCVTKKGTNFGIKYLGKELPNSNLEIKEFREIMKEIK